MHKAIRRISLSISKRFLSDICYIGGIVFCVGAVVGKHSG